MKIIILSRFLLVLLLSALFVSCSDNNEYEDKNDNLVINHEYVDLGLPSGIKWATCNVGATKPEEYGGYYAWGETEEKVNYDWSSYKWCNGNAYSMTKYCTDNNYGAVDNSSILDLEDDVAHLKWGGSWRMPTGSELEELYENCDWQWTTFNDVYGYLGKGPNGNCIFLPAAGSYSYISIDGMGCYGIYWASLLDDDSNNGAWALYFGADDWDFDENNYRYNGRSIRPVCE